MTETTQPIATPTEYTPAQVAATVSLIGLNFPNATYSITDAKTCDGLTLVSARFEQEFTGEVAAAEAMTIVGKAYEDRDVLPTNGRFVDTVVEMYQHAEDTEKYKMVGEFTYFEGDRALEMAAIYRDFATQANALPADLSQAVGDIASIFADAGLDLHIIAV